MIVNFEDTKFTGEVQAELVRLEQAGIVRVLDVLFVAKSHDGVIEAIRTDEIHSGELSQALLGIGVADAEIQSIADGIQPGDAAGIMVLEHRWALPLLEGLAQAGGTEITTQSITAADLERLGVALPAD
jgi:uncharacterized membrane protein